MNYQWGSYVSVAKRRANATKKMDKLRKKGQDVQPLIIEGKKIAHSFWGKGWCDHLESYSDFSNRLPRGRTYVRNGSVCHLKVSKGEIEAYVSGSSIYSIRISIDRLPQKKWQSIKTHCSGQISSILDLLRGSLSDGVMNVVTDKRNGMFPSPKEIHLSCNCPDWAGLCKHLAAVLYGVGSRLDQSPELLFLLRGVDHLQLVDAELNIQKTASTGRRVKGNLSDVFGIDFDEEALGKESFDEPPIANKPRRPIELKPKSPTKPKKRALSKAILNNQKPAKRAFTITAKGVVRLRKKFSMNKSQFAILTGVSPATVSKWEEYDGRLSLKPVNRNSLEKLSTIDNTRAWKLFKKR